ncbi:MAG: hypothetical protein KGJ35_02140 [Patescibacteria group bacterium]|nr:hypothetical protein [Patescibacteria group bacterium]
MQTAYINGAACIGRIHVDSDNLFLRQQVVSALKNLCIPFNHWGTYKQSRSIGKLVEYLKTGEVIWDGTSDTHVIPVSVGHVRFIKNRQLIELRDVGQIFRNGHEHKRSFSGTFGEKIMTKKGEDGIATVRRGL